MNTLIAGANTVLTTDKCKIQLAGSKAFGKELGVICLPLNQEKKVVTSPAYLHEPKAWASVAGEAQKPTITLDLQHIFEEKGAQHVYLIVYCYADPTLCLPAVEIRDITITINDDAANYDFSCQDRHIKAVKVLDIYKRNNQYKCRALAETTTEGLLAFAKGLDISLDERFPPTDGNATSQTHAESARPKPQPGEQWTGTAFAIDRHHLLTCEHVVHGASLIGLHQRGLPDIEAHVVIKDYGSDCALLRVETPLENYLPLRLTCYDMLGEEVTTLGFPVSGISSQLQVTQGNISGLLGRGEDIRFLQFTAPIQPGSSGSPVILPTGDVVGMVSSSIVHEHIQNLNFAVKHQLLAALLASAGLNLSELQYSSPPSSRLSTPQLTKHCRAAIWMIGCRA